MTVFYNSFYKSNMYGKFPFTFIYDSINNAGCEALKFESNFTYI